MTRMLRFGIHRDGSSVGAPILLLVALFTIPAVLFCQGYFGTVSGILTDQTGAVIPGKGDPSGSGKRIPL